MSEKLTLTESLVAALSPARQLQEATVKPGDKVTVVNKDGSKQPAKVERVDGDTVVVRTPTMSSDGLLWNRLSPEKKFPASQVHPGA